MGIPTHHLAVPDVLEPIDTADALFNRTMQGILRALYGRPDRSFHLSELVRLAGCGSSGVQRRITSLVRAGLVVERWDGNQRRFQADERCPIHQELHAMAIKTFALVEPLRAVMRNFRKEVSLAYVVEPCNEVIELVVVGDRLADPDAIYEALRPLDLGRSFDLRLHRIETWPQEDLRRRREKRMVVLDFPSRYDKA